MYRLSIIGAFFSLYVQNAYAAVCDEAAKGQWTEAFIAENKCASSTLSNVINTGDAQLKFVKAPGDAIMFKPFNIGDFCKTFQGNSCEVYFSNANDPFTMKDEDGNKYFDGTIGQYAAYINDREADLNKSGFTLRAAMSDSSMEVIANAYEIPTDRQELQTQLLNTLQLDVNSVLPNILNVNPKADCPKLPEPGENLESVSSKAPRIKIPGVIDMGIDDLIRRVNEQQVVLCSLGASYFDYVDINSIRSPVDFFTQVIALKNEILLKYGISTLAQTFSMEAVQAVQGVLDIAKSIQNLINAKQQPSPAQIYQLSKNLNAVMPAEYRIPSIPNIPSPVPPSRLYLELKKRKEWTGLAYGKQDLMGTYAKAYYEIRGSEDEQSATAFGDGGIYIFGRSISAVGGYVDGAVGKNGVEANAALKVFGQDVFPPYHKADSFKVTDNNPNWKSFDFDEAYRSSFMVGPVPLTVEAGALASVGIGYEFGLINTQLLASITPYASATAYAKATAGIPGVLAVGAKAELMIINASFPLTGFAAVKFDSVGYPYITLNLDSRAKFEAMNGRVYAFADYLVPRASVPPWKKMRSTYDIVNWGGMKNEHKIMNWGIEIGRNKTTITGELIDQTDRQESESLGQALNLEDRTIEVYKLQNEVSRKIDAMIIGLEESNYAEIKENKNPDRFEDVFGRQTNALIQKVDAVQQGLLQIAGMGT